MSGKPLLHHCSRAHQSPGSSDRLYPGRMDPLLPKSAPSQTPRHLVQVPAREARPSCCRRAAEAVMDRLSFAREVGAPTKLPCHAEAPVSLFFTSHSSSCSLRAMLYKEMAFLSLYLKSFNFICVIFLILSPGRLKALKVENRPAWVHHDALPLAQCLAPTTRHAIQNTSE